MASDIAGVIAFLLSDLSRQMTGQVVVVDGGQTLAAPMPVLRMQGGGA